MTEFFQDGPQLRNTYEGDDLLRGYLARVLPSWTANEAEPRIFRMGARAASDLLHLSQAAELEAPRLVPFDAWGRRIDRIETSAAWRALHAIAAEEGVVSMAYERQHGEYSRLIQFAMLYLFHPSSAWVSCPLAMSDGAARVLELHADEALRNRALPRLLSRDPNHAWTSGQWMTERTGGSDVSGTDTTARGDGHSHRLYGTKWFSSATTSEMALTLARLEGAPAGSRGLTLFYLETRGFDGGANGIRVLRLKDKLGTRALPTAELQLDGTAAIQVGAAGEGVRTVATMLNITRLYNACCAAGTMRRATDLARDYASRRRAFGRELIDQPLHRATIAGLEVESRAALLLVLRAAELLGRDEVGVASAEERAQLRLLTPLAKLLTGKQAVAVTSEALECFGGAGYIEDTGLPRLSRDAQVLPIWEGTTNVLALDVQRVLRGEPGEDGALRCLLADAERRLSSPGPPLAAAAAQVSAAAASLIAWRATALQAGEDAVQASARSFALGLARVVAGALLIEHGDWELATRSAAPTAAAARAWAAALAPAHGIEPADERLLAYGPR